MRHFRAALPYIGAALALISIATASTAIAREKLSYLPGMAQCTAWCDSHNSTGASRQKCYARCDHYWIHAASDGEQYQVDGT
jgi:hypothetical protein